MPASFTEPVRHPVPGGEFSTIHNGRYWETVFFPANNGDGRTIHDLHGPDDAEAFALKLNSIHPLAAAIVLNAYKER